ARQKRSAEGADDASGLPTTPTLPDLSGIGDMIQREAARIGSGGSVNPAAMPGLALSSDAAARTAAAAEEAARDTKRIERELKTGDLAFPRSNWRSPLRRNSAACAPTSRRS